MTDHDRPDRRRFLRLGLGAAPVVLTLTSRPALARSCATLSATASMAADPLTSAGHGMDVCLGGSPGRWRRAKEMRGLFGNAEGPVFQTVFGFLWDGAWKPETRFGDVLKMTGSQDPRQFGAHLVAAYCNAMEYAGRYPLTTRQVVDIGTAIAMTGAFQVPDTHQYWGVEEVKAFLEQTYTLD
jgi:hypothetical protein